MPGCSASFENESSLKRHEDIHNNTPRFKCVYCQYTSSLITQFSDHMANHYGELEYKCDVCGHVATTRANLNKHMDIHNQIKYKCTVCSAILDTSVAHGNHVSEHHDIHENKSEYRIAVQPEVTEEDMNETFPNRYKKTKDNP